MVNLGDIAGSRLIKKLLAFTFLCAFAVLRLQPLNSRVYFPTWYLKVSRQSPKHPSRSIVDRFVNLDYRRYMRLLNWILKNYGDFFFCMDYFGQIIDFIKEPLSVCQSIFGRTPHFSF